MTETKVCSCCKKEKELDHFRFLPTQNRYQTKCRECECAYTRDRYAKLKKVTPETRAERRRQYAVSAVANYIKLYGEGILDEAKEKNKSQPS